MNPLEALERGFALFQSTFALEGWRYYAGAAPLILCFIPLWVFDGQVRVSSDLLLAQAAMLAAAYLLRVWSISIYVQRVRERAFGVPAFQPAGAAARAGAMARLLAWKITLSIAALATLPTIAGASWFYSACQFAGLEAREDTSETRSLGNCLALSGRWFAGGLLLFLMLFPLWAAVWLNGFIVAAIVPRLLHSVLGLNTILSTRMGIDSLLRSSAFWLSLFAGAWVALDPIVKCTFVVVYQDLRSRREGDDLRGLLAGLPREQQKRAALAAAPGGARRTVSAALVLLAACLFGTPQTARARWLPVPRAGDRGIAIDSAQQERVEALRDALREESQRSIYRWHDAAHPTPPSWLDKLLVKTGHAIGQAWKEMVSFLRKLWPQGLHFPATSGKFGKWQIKNLRLWLGLLAVFTLLVGGILLWRRQRRSTAEPATPVAAALPLPDLSDAAVASERTEDEWFTLADQLEAQGELRLALRAAYLGLLAGLARREWLTIRRDRTNREYLQEFTRRWRRRPQASLEARAEIPEKLRGSLRQFDRVWYGFHELTPGAVAVYRQDQRELLHHV